MVALTKLLNTDTVVLDVMPAGGGWGVKRRPDVRRMVRLSRRGGSEEEDEEGASLLALVLMAFWFVVVDMCVQFEFVLIA